MADHAAGDLLKNPLKYLDHLADDEKKTISKKQATCDG